MKTVRRHWYNIGGIAGLISIGTLIYAWNDMVVLQRLLFMNFIALLIHQYEEYGFPGGEPAIMNMVIQPSDTPDRYPLNQNSAMIINVLAAYFFYLIPVFFPDMIWLGIAPTLFGFGQFIIHGIVTPKKLGQFYNPGLGAVILLHFPIGGLIIYQIISNHLSTSVDWIVGVVYMFAFTFITLMKMTYTWLSDKNSPYIFPAEEMRRFNVEEKIMKLKNRKAN
ncbi:MAG: HXXEE domain-containing protein [Chitinophagales bacterium]|nr:HXXEE domain-containing protein [Chitinophagales bacterium]